MRYFIFTDIHGNMEAFSAILRFAKKRKINHYLFLGDMVGYGASPNEVMDQLHTLQPINMIRGNHDKAVCCELESVQTFNPIAAAAIHWTRDNVSPENLTYLTEMKKGPEIVHENITICHGSPFDEDYYIFGEFDAAEAFLHIETQVTFFGHTHFPFVYTDNDHIIEGTFLTGNSSEIKIEKGTRYLINPGSVGQPRDRNTRAACAIYDSDAQKISFFRVEYEIDKAQKRILDAGLPAALAERLSIGI